MSKSDMAWILEELCEVLFKLDFAEHVYRESGEIKTAESLSEMQKELDMITDDLMEKCYGKGLEK